MAIGRVRPAVTGIPAYRPGKAAEQAEEEHGIRDAVKLASNENPHPPVEPVVAAMAAAPSQELGAGGPAAANKKGSRSRKGPCAR